MSAQVVGTLDSKGSDHRVDLGVNARLGMNALVGVNARVDVHAHFGLKS